MKEAINFLASLMKIRHYYTTKYLDLQARRKYKYPEENPWLKSRKTINKYVH